MKKIALIMAVVAVLFCKEAVYAKSNEFAFGESEKNAAYCWIDTEAIRVNTNVISAVKGKEYNPTWKLREEKQVKVKEGVITLRSYTMTFLNDTKLCKGITVHSSSFCGYVRVRFEDLLGNPIAGSDSGRKVSFTGTYAETPTNKVSEGWSGIAHVYCGSCQ
ncbi:MAG: hypothetical protein MJ123_05875 [Lachnospiraceae bacterium]|nr:hypothetical protein [Lachnospiraceae bacterium]